MALIPLDSEGGQSRSKPVGQAAVVLLRAGKTLAVCLAIVGSLLTFPGGIPWMAAFWLLGFTAACFRGRSGWLSLAVCLATLLIKGLPWWNSVLALLCALGLALLFSVLAALRRPATMTRSRIGIASAAMLWLAWAVLALDWHFAAHTSRHTALSMTRPIVFVGDSLTAGVPPYGGYVPLVQKRLTPPIIDLSQAGITSAEALQKLPELLAARPQAVVIELGGHDFLRGHSRAETRANLERFIVASREAGAEPILMEIPRGFIVDPYAGVERDLARQYDLELISDTPIRALVLWSPHAPPGLWTGGPYLSQDGLHPNANGNQHLAQAVISALSRVLGPGIRKDDPP